MTWFFAFLVLGVPKNAAARFSISGLADLQYEDFLEDSNETGNIEASQFTQRYELGLSKQAPVLVDGFGSYFFSIRYQYLDFKSEVNDESLHGAAHKFLWSGNMEIKPRRVPVVLKLYGGDQAPLDIDTISVSGAHSSLAPDIKSDVDWTTSRIIGVYLETGTHIVSGGNGNGGNGNGGNGNGGNGNGGNGNGGNGNGGNGNGGNGNGRRRFSFFSLPKMFFEYRNTYKDIEDVHEEWDEMRFSINDGRNWLHYSMIRYDNLQSNGSEGDYTDETVQVGNVARSGQREWFYISNWTLLSMDASYNKKDYRDTPDAHYTYSANVFANSFGSWWDANFFGTYRQSLNHETNEAENELTLPLYITATPSKDVLVNWKNSFRHHREYDLDLTDGSDMDEEDRRELIEDISSIHRHVTKYDLTYSQRYNLINTTGTDSEDSTYHMLSFSLDSSAERTYGYGGSYVFTTVTDNDAGDDGDDYTSHSFSIHGRFMPTERISLSGSQSAIFVEDEDMTLGDGTPVRRSSQYKTDVAANIYIHRTLTVDIRTTYSLLMYEDDGQNRNLTTTGNLRYTPVSWLRVTSTNGFVDEKIQSTHGVNSVTGDTTSSGANRTHYYTNNRMNVNVTASLTSTTKIDYAVEDDKIAEREIVSLDLSEGIEYTILSDGFRVRKLLSLTASVERSETRSNDEETELSTRYSGGIHYYPYRYMAMGGSAAYEDNEFDDAVKRTGSLYISFPFPKLTINTTYYFEDYDASVDSDDYDSQKFYVKLSKTF